MNPLNTYASDELKLIYRLLHAQIQAHPALMDAQLLQDLQFILQARAREEGVDVSMHAQWSAWLGEGPTLRGL